jgi:hypothetical protein
MARPRVICHMVASVDGRIVPDGWPLSVDVRKHYENGADLIDDFANKERRLPDAALRDLRWVKRPCLVRERCRLRRLRVNGTHGA